MKKMTSSMARVIRNGGEKRVPSTEVVLGDLLVLEEGDRVAADARLIETAELRASEASLTGESTPVEKNTNIMNPSTPVADRRNMVFYGTHIVHGRGKAVVISTGSLTEFGKIAELVQEAKESVTPLQEKMDRFSKTIAKIVLVVSVSIFILLSIQAGKEFWSRISEPFMIAVSLAISAVPEGLPAITAVTLALGAQVLAKRRAIIRRLSSAETLGSVTVICSDKTGTLTKGEMTVRQIYMNKFVDVSGSGYYPKGEFQIEGFPLSREEKEELEPLLKIGALCNNAKLVKQDFQDSWMVLGDPTEGALIVVSLKAGIDKETLEQRFPRVKEIPFSSERKIMTTIHKMDGEEYIAYVKGASEIVIQKSSHIYSNRREVVLTDAKRQELLKVNEMMASRGLRVLAMAYKKLSNIEQFDLENNLTFVGLQGLLDPPRLEAIEANRRCATAGIKTVMITGDHKLTATAMAEEIGILKEGSLVLTGEELEEMDDSRFEKIVDRVSVYARVSPAHKQKIVKALKARGHIVAMTGDGVNDAPAIKNADIGIAMGITGTDVTKEVSHMILADDNFATIVGAVEQGRIIFDNIRKYTRFLIAANFDEVFLLTLFIFTGLPIPLLPAMILWINLVTDGGPAIALSVDPVEEDVMNRPPRN
ncbi:HAD-IC family P-type ATPase, partial [Candidatus Bathyarchaeota archaeon]|nr:HAD-IC family P-type ATPase [Candidatus Bathyarchaeota archaeon]